MSGTVAITFRARGGDVAYIYIPHSGKCLRDYLKDPRLKKYSLIEQALKSSVVNQQGHKMRLTSRPNAGDSIAIRRRGL